MEQCLFASALTCLPVLVPLPQLLEYVGKGKSIMDVGLAQARHPLTTRRHYYELEIVDAGEKCYIALGLARRVSEVTSCSQLLLGSANGLPCRGWAATLVFVLMVLCSNLQNTRRHSVLERERSDGSLFLCHYSPFWLFSLVLMAHCG